VITLKQKLYTKINVPPSKIYLVSQGKTLKDEMKLVDYDIKANSTIDANVKFSVA
jgi:hypothetical protein